MIVDLFAGPGGWDVGLSMLGVDDVVGLEWDTAACATRSAAGHATIQCDVSAYPTTPFEGKVSGLIASPPCQDFSMAGKRAGITGERGMLIHEVMRWARALEPEWVACEQVPPALPVWELFCHELRGMGYKTWAGVLNAADFGVPQTRKRAILMAHRDVLRMPEPTHAKDPQGEGLFGAALLPWVTMADALGWGCICPTRCDCEAPEPTAGIALRSMECPEHNHDPKPHPECRAHFEFGDIKRPNAAIRSSVEPAPTVFFGNNNTGYRFMLHTNRDQRPDGTRQTVDPDEHPAPALTGKSGGQWVLRNNNQQNAAKRGLDEPAPTMFFGKAMNDVRWVHATTSRQNAEGSVRVTVEQAAVLQSFPHDYPWQGSKTKKFEQVGNAVPPLLAAHVLAPMLGVEARKAVA